MDTLRFQKKLETLDLRLMYSPLWINSAAIRGNLPELVDIEVDWSTSPPTAKGCGGISISHSPAGGVVLYSDTKTNIGIDIEVKLRIVEKLVDRVSDEREKYQSPLFSYLWVAKESAFKALAPANSTVVLSQITVESWTKLESDIWQFEANHNESNRKIKGYLLDSPTLLLAATFVVSD